MQDNTAEKLKENYSAAYRTSNTASQQNSPDSGRNISVVNKQVPLHNQAPKVSKAVVKILAVCIPLAVILGMRVQQGVTDAQIRAADKELTELQSAYVVMQMELEQIQTLDNLQETAAQKYGLVKQDPSQVTYIDLTDGNKTQVSAQSDIWDNIVDFFKGLFGK